MPSMGRTFKYYPSTAFLPSVALGTLLTPSNLAAERGVARVSREFSEVREFREVRERAARFSGTTKDTWFVAGTARTSLNSLNSLNSLINLARLPTTHPVILSHSQSGVAMRCQAWLCAVGRG